MALELNEPHLLVNTLWLSLNQSIHARECSRESPAFLSQNAWAEKAHCKQEPLGRGRRDEGRDTSDTAQSPSPAAQIGPHIWDYVCRLEQSLLPPSPQFLRL